MQRPCETEQGAGERGEKSAKARGAQAVHGLTENYRELRFDWKSMSSFFPLLEGFLCYHH